MITVNFNELFQRIDGFGASSAFMGSGLTPTQAELFFSSNNNIAYIDSNGTTTTCNGIGLSLLRNHIEPAKSPAASDTPTTYETSIMLAAQKYGAKVWSTPWTPAVGFKSRNDIYDSSEAPANNGLYGGSFLGSSGKLTNAPYATVKNSNTNVGANATDLAYASQLANYVASMKNQGINLYAISIQNEPDAKVTTYQACQWTPQQIRVFVPCLYQALANAGVGSTKIMLPESENWTDPKGLAAVAMNDPNVAANVGIVANHDYGDKTIPAAINAYGKALWQSEVSLLSPSESSPMANGLYWATRIHLFMTAAQANAYHYWSLISLSKTNGDAGLLDNNASLTKRLFVFGHFSRFIRPGYVRVLVSIPNIDPSPTASAYIDPDSGKFVIVAINNSGKDIPNQSFEVPEFNAGNSTRVNRYLPVSVTPWVTTSTLSLEPKPAISIANSKFSYDMPVASVVTFEGQSKLIAPTNK